MVMGPTHAMSGAVAWLAGAGITTAVLGRPQTPTELVVYTTVCAGSALLPDLDCSGRVLQNRGGATVARTFGVFSLFLAECVEKFAYAVYLVTKGPRDEKRTNGHRLLTHTWLFAVLLGLGVTLLVDQFGKPVVVGTLFLTVGLAIRGLMSEWARRNGWVLTTLCAGFATLLAIQILPEENGYSLLGIAVGAGCVVHTLGDMITRAGCPILFPIPIKGETYYEIRPPRKWALRAGGRFEKKTLMPALTVAFFIAAAWQLPIVQDWVSSMLDAVAGNDAEASSS